eukprot:g3692.t1
MRVGGGCVAALALVAGVAETFVRAQPGVPGAPFPGVAAPLPPGAGVGVGLPEVVEEAPGEEQPPPVESPIGPAINTSKTSLAPEEEEEPAPVEPAKSLEVDNNDEADALLDQVEGVNSSSAMTNIKAEENMVFGSIQEEATKALQAKHLLDLRVHKMHQQRLREETRQIQIRGQFNERLVRAQKTCSKWEQEQIRAKDDLDHLFEKSVDSSALARDGARRGVAPILVEKELHVTDMSINALRCQMNYMESLRVFVERACGVSKSIQTALEALIAAPSENVTIPSIAIGPDVPTRREINLLKLTASNALAKMDAARHDYDVEKARVDSRPPLSNPAEEAEIEAAAEGEEEEGQEEETPPHELPMTVLFKHITGRDLLVDPPKADAQKRKKEEERILKEQEDCFGDDCGDPKQFVPKAAAPAPATALSQ